MTRVGGALERRWIPWGTLAVGTGGCLVAFMLDALAALPSGFDAALHAEPTMFCWPLFLSAFALMGAGTVGALR